MICGESSRSSRRGNTYNPTSLRGPQPVQPPSMERGWTPPSLLRETPLPPALYSSSSDGEGPLMEDPPSYDDSFEDSDDPPSPTSHGSGRYRRQEPSALLTGLETVVEENEEEPAESTTESSGSSPYPKSPLGEDFMTYLTILSGLDAPPNYTASVHPSVPLPPGSPIESTQPPGQQPNPPILTPIHLTPIHLAPINLTPIVLGQAAGLEPDTPPDLSHLSHVRANAVSLPEYPSQRVFTRDSAFGSPNVDNTDLLQIFPWTRLRSRRVFPSEKEEMSRFQKQPVTMEKSMRSFRDFAASTAAVAGRDVPTPQDCCWGEDHPEEESEHVEAPEGRLSTRMKCTSQRIAEPIVSSIPPPLTSNIMSMEERWGVETIPENSSKEDGRGLRYTKDGRRRRLVRGDGNIGDSDGCTNKDEKCDKHYHHNPGHLPKLSSSRTYLPSQDRELRTPSPDIGVNVFSPQGNPNWRVPRLTRAPPAQRSLALASTQGFRGYFKSIFGAIRHHSWQLTQSGAKWSEVGDRNCQSCGWLGPITNTECSRCYSRVSFEVPRAAFLSTPQGSWNQIARLEEPARGPPASITKGSERIELQVIKSEQFHSPPGNPVGPADDEPQSENKRKKKKKKRGQNLDPK